MRKRGSDRIWPKYVASVGAMIERRVIVRFICFDCREVFDVDLQAVAAVRGRDYALLDRHTTCRRSRCRGRGCFAFADAVDAPFVVLAHRLLPPWLAGLRPCDAEPPDDQLPPGSPAVMREAKRA